MLKSKANIKFFICWWLAVCSCFVVSFAFEGRAQEAGKIEKIEVISQVPRQENVTVENRENEQATTTKETSNKQGQKDEDLTTLPPNGGKPMEVSIVVYITNIGEIDQAKENYEVGGYLDVRWKDERLAFDAKNERQKRRYYDLDQVWHPYLEFINRVGTKQSQDVAIWSVADGTVYYTEGFNVTLSSNFSLKRFPFDRQVLKIAIESFRYDKSEVVLIAEPNKSEINKDNFVGLSEWQIHKLNTKVVEKVADEDKKFTRFVGELEIVRNYQFYLGKVITPMVLIFLISAACFWIDIEYFESLVAIGLTNLLTAIAFSLTIAGSLPKVSYLTFMDGFITINYFFIFLSIMEIVFSHYIAQRGDKKLAETIHRKGRWVFPAGFVLSNLLLGLFLFMGF